jgi:predicted nucleic acid-binding protein
MPKIYLDSCLVIYLVEQRTVFYDKVIEQITKYPTAEFVVSSLTALEVLVKPTKEQNNGIINRYQTFLSRFQVDGMNDKIMLESIQYRASGLKTPDALHVAFAKHYQCDQFWTNDDRLAKVLTGWTLNVCT